MTGREPSGPHPPPKKRQRGEERVNRSRFIIESTPNIASPSLSTHANLKIISPLFNIGNPGRSAPTACCHPPENLAIQMCL